MDCLILPIAVFTRRRSGYRRLTGGDQLDGRSVIVIAGKEKREFLVEAYVLEENPFRVLMDIAGKDDVLRGGTRRGRGCRGFCRRSYYKEKVVFVDVDAILFEHMLWLMSNDCSSLFELNLKEIIDFYSQEI